MARAYVALGSNLGDRVASLEVALHGLASLPGTELVSFSSFYETRPVGGPEGQGDFVNSAACIETGLSPAELLAELQRLEREHGRDRGAEAEAWGPRTLDLDILFYDELTLDEPDLIVPHPRLTERAFVLAPLAEIAGDLRHPVTGSTISEHLEEMDCEHEGIRRLSF